MDYQTCVYLILPRGEILMSLSESDTRAKLIDPALYARGWREDFIKREETAGAVEVRGLQSSDSLLRKVFVGNG